MKLLNSIYWEYLEPIRFDRGTVRRIIWIKAGWLYGIGRPNRGGLITLALGDRSWHVGEQDGFLVYEGIQVQRDTFYVVCPCSIGDTFYTASLIESLKKHRALRRVCLIVKQAHSQIPDWFEAVDEKIIADEMTRVLHVFSILTGTWELKNYLCGHFRKNSDAKTLPEYEECEVKNMIYRYKKLVFRLPEDCLLEKPKIVPSWDTYHFLIDDLKVGENTIILFPYAQTAQALTLEFWEVLASLLSGLGYKVLTNVKDETELPIKGTTAICIDIATMAAVCEKCRLVIALRSGFCDVLAFTNTKMVVLNSDFSLYKEWDLGTVTDREGIYNLLVENSDAILPILKILEYDF